jgi:transmembrane sensor
MSNVDSEGAQAVAGASEIEAHAAMWLRRRCWEWNAAQQAEFDAWLALSWAHRVAFWRLEAAWDRTERLRVLRAAAHEQSAAGQKRKLRPLLFRATVGVVTCVFLSLSAMWWLSRPGEETYSTALGARKTIVLADGSSIELNTDTVLRMTIGAAGRTASLDKGEAYFQIKHNVVHPFVVMAGNHRVTDLGTKFVIRNDADELKVTLLEGRVRFDAHARPPILLTPGDELVATATSVSTMRKSAEQLSNELGWKRGLLIFQNTPLAEAAAEFNRYNSRKLIVADAAVGRRTIGASFPSDNVELFAQMARDVLRLHVEDRGDEIVISR